MTSLTFAVNLVGQITPHPPRIELTERIEEVSNRDCG
jgi:hypothetical protein